MSALLSIDDLIRRHHYYLDEDDECYYLFEYTARRGFNHSDGNNLIINLKKKMSTRGTSQWRYKLGAIDRIARELEDNVHLDIFEDATIVPMPPSKTVKNQEYDDRMVQIAEKAFAGIAEVRELVKCRRDMEAAHESQCRPSIEEIKENLVWGDSNPVESDKIIVLDDVLTAGAHFKAVKEFLLEEFPDKEVIGVFAARCVPPSAKDVFSEFIWDFE